MKCHLGYIFEIIKVFFDSCVVDAQELIGCVDSNQKSLKEFLRGAVSEFLPWASIQLVSSGEDAFLIGIITLDPTI